MHVAHTDIYILHRLVNNKAACTVYITWLNRGFTDFSNSTFREFSNPIYLAGFLGFGFCCVLVKCVLINPYVFQVVYIWSISECAQLIKFYFVRKYFGRYINNALEKYTLPFSILECFTSSFIFLSVIFIKKVFRVENNLFFERISCES